MSDARPTIDRWLPSPRAMRFTAILLGVELALALVYTAVFRPTVLEPRYAVYPFVWITAAVLAVAFTRPAPNPLRRRVPAMAVGVAYFLVLTWVGGMLAPGHVVTGLRIRWLPPGWGPALTYGGAWVRLTLFPFKLVGYLGLAYLVYATVLDAATSAVSGLLGLVSCVSCTWPVAASLLTGLLGGTSAVASVVYAWSYDLSTLVFLVAVLLLYWRPTIGR